MPKSTSKKQLDAARGRLVALCSVLLSMIFMISATTHLNSFANGGSEVFDFSFYFVPFLALVAAWISWTWDKRVRILTALSLGILFATVFIWVGVNSFHI